MCYEPRKEEFAKVCRERDALKVAYDGAKLRMERSCGRSWIK